MNNISFYFGHGASVSVECNGEYHTIEIERITRKRYFSLLSVSVDDAVCIINQCLDILEKTYGVDTNFDVCVFPGHSLRSQRLVLPLLTKLKTCIRAKHYIMVDHHMSHAACCAYQSPHRQGTIISFDGAGNDGRFNIYQFNDNIQHIRRVNVQSFGKCYRQISFILKDIIKTTNGVRKHLVGFAGKLMGLVAYGEVRQEWIEGFKKFYQTRDVNYLNEITGLTHLSEEQFKYYVDNNIPFEEYTGKLAYDLAATNQYVFEQEFFSVVESYIDSNNPILLTGGCALNVLLNEKVRNKYGNRVFVPPNPDDSGISLGQLFVVNPPKQKVDLVYSGLPIIDIDNFTDAFAKYDSTPVDVLEVATLIKQGNIIGVLRGNSEIGPRALGNRSILCDPTYPGMKDKLNKIKNREWYRPFASVVRLDDVEKYFNFDYESPYMSFSPTVKDEYIDIYPSIAHVDKTVRVQTVTREQNDFLYELLTIVDTPLINTSLNINGEPMVVSLEQVLNILQNTSLDYLIVNDRMIRNEVCV